MKRVLGVSQLNPAISLKKVTPPTSSVSVTVRTGSTLPPIMSVTVIVSLTPGGSVSPSLVTVMTIWSALATEGAANITAIPKNPAKKYQTERLRKDLCSFIVSHLSLLSAANRQPVSDTSERNQRHG